jgi:predicted nucleic acid-binding protein
MAKKGAFSQHNPWPILRWYRSFAKHVEATQLGKQRSRDAKDDPYLACALAARAEFIISRDSDLLILEKPFGIQMITPRAFLSRIAAMF